MAATGRPLYIINPAAGGGRGRLALASIEAVLRAEGWPAETVLTNQPGDATTLAQQAARDGFTPVIGVGGDGTIQEVAAGLLQGLTAPPLGIVPIGTGNDTARSLRLPRRVAAAVRLCHQGAPASIDVGRCGQRIFLNVGGAGFDAEVAAAIERRPRGNCQGALPYRLAILRELGRYINRDVVVTLDGQRLARRVVLVAVANGPYYAGGQMICPAAVMDDGLLDVCIVGDLPRWEILAMLPRLPSGRHIGHPKVECYRARRVEIAGQAELRVHIDGERAGHVPAVFEVAPGALRVMGAGWPAADEAVRR